MVCQYVNIVSMSIWYNGLRIGVYLLPYPLPQTHAHRLIIARGQYMYKVGPTWMIEFLIQIVIYQLPYPRLPSLSDASILMQRSVLDRWSVPAPTTALDWGGNSLAGPLHPPPRHHQPPGPSTSGPWHHQPPRLGLRLGLGLLVALTRDGREVYCPLRPWPPPLPARLWQACRNRAQFCHPATDRLSADSRRSTLLFHTRWCWEQDLAGMAIGEPPHHLPRSDHWK